MNGFAFHRAQAEFDTILDMATGIEVTTRYAVKDGIRDETPNQAFFIRNGELLMGVNIEMSYPYGNVSVRLFAVANSKAVSIPVRFTSWDKAQTALLQDGPKVFG